MPIFSIGIPSYLLATGRPSCWGHVSYSLLAGLTLTTDTYLLNYGYSAFWMDGRPNPHEAATIFARGRGYGGCDPALLTYQIIGRDPSRSNPAGLFDRHSIYNWI